MILSNFVFHLSSDETRPKYVFIADMSVHTVVLEMRRVTCIVERIYWQHTRGKFLGARIYNCLYFLFATWIYYLIFTREVRAGAPKTLVDGIRYGIK